MCLASFPLRAAIAFSVALLAGCASTELSTCDRTQLAYVGTDGGGVQALRFDACTGMLSSLGIMAKLTKPRWSVANPVRPILYVADDVAGQDGRVVAFAVDHATGALTQLSETDSGGLGTTHLWLDAPSSTLIAANFLSGSATSLPLSADGRVADVASTVTETGSGPTKRQAKAHAHGIAIDPTGRFAIVSDFGADGIFIYDFDRSTHALVSRGMSRAPAFAAEPGSGPHHSVFSLDGHYVYVLNELTANVISLRWDRKTARLTPVQTQAISSLDFKGPKSGAELALGRDGRFIYVADRGENAIVVFRASPTSGELALVQRLPSGGDKPWGFAIDPAGRWMLVANSTKVSEFRIDQASGLLTDTGNAVESATPLSISFVP